MKSHSNLKSIHSGLKVSTMASQRADSTPHYKGKDSVPLMKDNGMMEIPAKDLSIIWGKDERYWQISDDSKQPAVLQQVSWLEVTCCVDETDLKKEYEVGFKLSFRDFAFGWNKYPVHLMIKRGNEQAIWIKKLLSNEKDEFQFIGSLKAAEKGNDDKKIYFGLYEVWSGYWKGGLKIHNAFIQEKN